MAGASPWGPFSGDKEPWLQSESSGCEQSLLQPRKKTGRPEPSPGARGEGSRQGQRGLASQSRRAWPVQLCLSLCFLHSAWVAGRLQPVLSPTPAPAKVALLSSVCALGFCLYK